MEWFKINTLKISSSNSFIVFFFLDGFHLEKKVQHNIREIIFCIIYKTCKVIQFVLYGMK
jgi:hypothetical protein